jgi:hypothetical protein
MSVDQKPTHPLFIGTFHEIGDRILSSSLSELLEAALAEQNTWGVLILRIMMEQTPIKDVQRGETPIGLHIRNHILFEKYCSTFYECAFRIYGAEVWGVIEEELERVTATNTYPQLLIERLRDILRFDGVAMRHFIEWTLAHPSSSRLLRLLAAISLHGNWYLSGRALLSLYSHESTPHDELMRVSRELMMEKQSLFPSEVIIDIIDSKDVLPELRAAVFSILYDRQKSEPQKQLLLLSIPAFIEDPGNATALHAVAWRIAKVLPEDAIALFGRKLRSMDYQVFQPRETQTRWNFTFCSMLHNAAIWQYFHNIPKKAQLEMFERENLSFPEALACLIRHSDKKTASEPGDDFHKAERQAWEFVSNHEYLYTLMLMFSKVVCAVAGLPNWDRIKWTIQHFPAEVQHSCVEVANRLNRLERGEAAPDVAQLVRFVKTAWEAESRYNKYAFFRKQLVEIRNVLDYYGYYPEAVAELTQYIATRGIRDTKKK